MPNKKKTHNDNRLTVCYFCLSKSTRNITPNMHEQIIKLGFTFSLTDLTIPVGICEKCRSKLKRGANLDNKGGSLTIPLLRGQAEKVDCECTICIIGKTKHRKGQNNKENSASKDTNISKICNICFSTLHPGCVHKCNKTTAKLNLLSRAKESNTAEQIASHVV